MRSIGQPQPLYTLLLCAANGAPAGLAHAFPAPAYRVLTGTPKAIDAALSTHHPDAVLAFDVPATRRLFQKVATHHNGGPAPLRILIASDSGQAASAGSADLVLSGARETWGAQVAPILHMRAENVRLRAELDALRRASSAPDSELETLKLLIVNNVTHELRTPVLQLKSAIDALAKMPGNSTAMLMAQTATARVEDVVQNIAQLAQSRAIKPDLALTHECVEFARRWLEKSWKYKDKPQRVFFELPPNLPPILADKKGIGSVLQLLIDNALKFSHERVHVSAVREGDRVRLCVQDWGIGIAPEDFQRILEPFIQIDPSSTRRYGGAGVGLTLVKMILDKHDTKLEIESGLGKGSLFSFTLATAQLGR
jgi:signal transduction histidine kinase